ncbi:MAG: aminodeoxychorismate synthase component I [Myxococcota bacterium]
MTPPVGATAVRELSPRCEWLRLVAGLAARPGFWWLDSALVDARLGRFSFAGAEPWGVLRAFGSRTVCERRRARHEGERPGRSRGFGDPLDALRAWLAPPLPADGPPAPGPFVGGAVLALAYELGAPAPAGSPAPQVPELTALGVDRLYAFDHLEGRGYAFALGYAADTREAQRRADAAAAELVRELPDASPPPAPRAEAASLALAGALDEERHAKAVAEIQARIAAGDVYQTCLTARREVAFDGDALALAGALRTLNPAPFAAVLRLPDATLVGSSPERFLRVGLDRWAESRPIKGTRPRAADPDADRRLRATLAGSEKDRAENLMIVDLVRNDLGRVCEVGSVHVPELFAIEPYETVFQLVSTVRGRLATGVDALDAVRAAFPPGSMTGAPKRAAMQLLARLEPDRRGLYSGAVGYLDARGSCDLAVTIRSIVLAGGRAFVHSGGGIVADSEAAAEWAEARDKARALEAALCRAPDRW